jgi:pyruvate dehydrogenase E2 component (dihydrolipoamide acetyltransferase)
MSDVSSSGRVEVPDIGDFDDVPIIEILVSVGDTVSAEDPLVTLESDKATMDVPAPLDGAVKEILVSVGDTVSQGSELMVIEPAGNGSAEDGEVAGSAPSQGSAPSESAEAAAPAEAEPAESSAAAAASEPAAASGADAPSQPPAETEQTAPPTPGERAGNGGGPIYASPSARRIARELGVDLHDVAGSGRKGRITPDDVRAAAERPAAAGAGPVGAGAGASAGGLELLPWPSVDFEKYGPVERVPRSRIQRISAPNLHRNWVMIPHVTQNDEADITDLEAWRKQLNEEHKGSVKFTMVSFLVKACVVALKQFPDVNASLDGEELVRKRYYNIGFAADTPNGLVVPVIRDADTKGLAEIAAELTELSGLAREGKLSRDQMSGATFTISSLGGIGGTSFTPIINAPEVAILGVTRSVMRPVWNGSEFVPRLMVPLSFSYDHRVIDGAAAARFVVFLCGVLSDLRRALL